MYDGRYVFTQITMYLPQRQFRRIVSKFNDRTQNWSFSHWNHLLVLIFGQLLGCGTLRELTDITTAHDVTLFVDRNLLNATKVSFHPNDNRASLVITRDDMLKFIKQIGNPYEIVDLY